MTIAIFLAYIKYNKKIMYQVTNKKGQIYLNSYINKLRRQGSLKTNFFSFLAPQKIKVYILHNIHVLTAGTVFLGVYYDKVRRLELE